MHNSRMALIALALTRLCAQEIREYVVVADVTATLPAGTTAIYATASSSTNDCILATVTGSAGIWCKARRAEARFVRMPTEGTLVILNANPETSVVGAARGSLIAGTNHLYFTTIAARGVVTAAYRVRNYQTLEKIIAPGERRTIGSTASATIERMGAVSPGFRQGSDAGEFAVLETTANGARSRGIYEILADRTLRQVRNYGGTETWDVLYDSMVETPLHNRAIVVDRNTGRLLYWAQQPNRVESIDPATGQVTDETTGSLIPEPSRNNLPVSLGNAFLNPSQSWLHYAMQSGGLPWHGSMAMRSLLATVIRWNTSIVIGPNSTLARDAHALGRYSGGSGFGLMGVQKPLDAPYLGLYHLPTALALQSRSDTWTTLVSEGDSVLAERVEFLSPAFSVDGTSGLFATVAGTRNGSLRRLYEVHYPLLISVPRTATAGGELSVGVASTPGSPQFAATLGGKAARTLRFDAPTGTVVLAVPTDLSAGQATLALSVNYGGRSIAFDPRPVGIAVPSVGAECTVAPAAARVHETVTLRCQSLRGVAPFQVTWAAGSETLAVLSAQGGSAAAAQVSFSTPGARRIDARVTDSAGASVTISAPVTINALPPAQLTADCRASGAMNPVNVPFAVACRDFRNGTAPYVVAWEHEGAPVATASSERGDPINLRVAFGTEGVRRLEGTIVDATGTKATLGTITLTVTPGRQSITSVTLMSAGGLATVAGTNLAARSVDCAYPLQPRCEDVRVLVNELSVFPVRISPSEVTFYLPQHQRTADAASLRLVLYRPQNGQELQALTNTITAAVTDTAPVLFGRESQPTITEVDSSGPVRDLDPGEALEAGRLYRMLGTGFGITNPRVSNGNRAPSDPLAESVEKVTLKIGEMDVAATVFLEPGHAGLFRLQFQAPAPPEGAETPELPVVLIQLDKSVNFMVKLKAPPPAP